MNWGKNRHIAEQQQKDLGQARYDEYASLLQSEAKKRNVCGPHCDAYVLHHPGQCEYCDGFPALQAARIRLKICFTGNTAHHGWLLCPAEVRRSKTTIEKWYGNRAHPTNSSIDFS